MTRILLLLSLLTAMTLIGACAATPSQESTMDVGGITVNCSGPDSGWVFCYRTASELCGTASYTILKRNGDALAAGAAGETRMMLVKCN
jgi:hypothetical protein